MFIYYICIYYNFIYYIYVYIVEIILFNYIVDMDTLILSYVSHDRETRFTAVRPYIQLYNLLAVSKVAGCHHYK